MAHCPDNWDIILASGVEEVEVLYAVAKCRPLTHPELLLLAAVRYYYTAKPEQLADLLAVAQEEAHD